MMKTPLYRRLQSELWNEETLNKIDVDIEKADDPVAEAGKQASQLIESTTTHRRWDIVAISVAMVLLLALIIPGGIWAYSKIPSTVSDVTTVPPTEVVEGEETPIPATTNSLAVVTPVETTTAELRPNLQVAIDKSNIPEELRLDTQFDLVFQISNMGTDRADNVFVHYNLPDSLELAADSGQGNCLGQGRSISCQVGQIGSGVQGTGVRSAVRVINDQSAIELTAENYWVTGDAIEDVYGTEPLHLTVVAPIPSRIELTADPSILYISGVEQPIMQTEIIARVYDQWGQIYDREVLSVEISIPPDSGSFDATTQGLVGGTAVFTYTAAEQPDTVPITAILSVDPPVRNFLELTVAQVTSPKSDTNEQLYFTPEDELPFLTQITTQWPVEIIGQPQNQRFPVAINLWIARNLIDTESNQLSLSNIQMETGEDQIRYAKDKNPDTYPSDPFSDWGENYPRMYQSDLVIQLEIRNDDPGNDYVLIRIKGWMPVEQLQPPAK